MTDKIRNLLEDVQTVYEGKGMVVHPNSFDQLRMEVIKLDSINKQQSEQLTKAVETITALLNVFVYDLADDEMDSGDIDTKIKAEQFLKEVEK
jgi:hypothetical protein